MRHLIALPESDFFRALRLLTRQRSARPQILRLTRFICSVTQESIRVVVTSIYGETRGQNESKRCSRYLPQKKERHSGAQCSLQQQGTECDSNKSHALYDIMAFTRVHNLYNAVIFLQRPTGDFLKAVLRVFNGEFYGI
ncbi:hypothetical protein F2P81_019524 [Scophthalmus maximus]|uniref:Uncharacterized protein n=1 Tax=Scophthalmus maximus TaxID=52904 RepID=A0A6A4S5X3_SCOMX|nr:hypothetical protein F2P81_019524 [Scophthalmus maximus]